jgi:hypothetical protein
MRFLVAGYPTISRLYIYERQKQKCRLSCCDRVLNQRSQFSRCRENVCCAGINTFIGVFGRDTRLDEAVHARSREFVKLFSFWNPNLLLIVLREDIWIGSYGVSLRRVWKKLVIFTCLSDLCPGVTEIFNWSLLEYFKVRRSRISGAIPSRLLYAFVTV